MKSSRAFVRKNGKLEIKQVVEQDDSMTTVENGRIGFVSRDTKLYRIYLSDLKAMLVDDPSCAFLRAYIPGEFEGVGILENTDLSEITDVLVIIGQPEGHVEEHLKPLGSTYRAICFTVEPGMPPLARVPLLPEQAAIIRQEAEKERE
jgi:hypothetical protein